MVRQIQMAQNKGCSGLTIVGPSCIHQHNARESARRRAQHDAFGADRGAPWRNPTNGGG